MKLQTYTIKSEYKEGVSVAEGKDKDKIIAAITLAFSADPMIRWTLRNADTYLSVFPKLVKAFGGKAFENSTAFCPKGFTGGALWLPPSIEPDYETMAELVDSYIEDKNKADVYNVMEQMDAAHPKEPCWYLPLIGVDPSHQKEGIGTALLQHSLAQIDKLGDLAYLESSNPRNIPLYERFGFAITGSIQSGSSPIMYPMVRHPQPRE